MIVSRLEHPTALRDKHLQALPPEIRLAVYEVVTENQVVFDFSKEPLPC